MAKRSTVKAGRTPIKGATAADKQNIAAGKRAAQADAEALTARENTRNAAATPEEAPTARERREAAQKLFDKADEQGQAEIIATNAARISAYGF